MRLTNLLSRSAAVAAFAALAVPAGASAAKPADRDHDKMPDRWELAHKLNTHRNDAGKDADRDGLKNLAEFRAHTDPRDADTDNDGVRDGKERAGTIVSLTGGVLTLTLFDGSTLTGKADDRTEVECAPAPAPAAPASVRHGGDSGPGTTGDDESDDDGPGHDAGDDDAPATMPPATGGPAPAGTPTPTGHHDQGDDEDQADDQDSGDDEQEQTGGCGLADLTAGARVDEAQIAVTAAGIRFTMIELG